MVTVETIGRVRHAFHVKGDTIKQISRELRLARNTVRGIVRGEETERSYARKSRPRPKLGGFAGEVDRMLEENAKRPKRERVARLSPAAAPLDGIEFDRERDLGRDVDP